MTLFRFQPQKSTAVAFAVGAAVILLSMAMLLFQGSRMETALHILLRDVLMMFLVGFCFPILYVRANEERPCEALGITKRKWKRSLLLNVVFAALLLAGFLLGNDEAIAVRRESLFAVSYILTAGVFEMVCIYGFLRCYFEKAFGTVPAVLLTALFYSLHHAGFQPEFGKLFFVGVMYCGVFYITRNIFIIFPFFWGVGAVWDVLINSPAGQSLQNPTTFIVAVVLQTAMAAFAAGLIFLQPRPQSAMIKKKREKETVT